MAYDVIYQQGRLFRSDFAAAENNLLPVLAHLFWEMTITVVDNDCSRWCVPNIGNK